MSQQVSCLLASSVDRDNDMPGLALTALIVSLFFPTIPKPEEWSYPRKEKGIWGNLSIIDCHGHIGSFKGYDLDTKTLLSNIERHGVKMVLVSNIDGANLPGTTKNFDEVQANTLASEIIRAHPKILRGLIWTRPNDGKPEQVELFLKETFQPGETTRVFVGLKLHPMMNQFPADDPVVDGYLALCERYGVPAVFHSDKPGTHADPQKIYSAARRHPKVPVILYHSTFFGPHDAALDVVKSSRAKNDADLYLETAQVSTGYVIEAVKAVGSDRVLFGTDATYFGKEHYGKYEAMVQTLREKLSPQEFGNVMAHNAERLFRLH